MRKKHYFYTWGEFLTQAEKPGEHGGPDVAQSPPSTWNGNVTYPEALRLGREGWTEGERAIAALSKTLESVVLPGIVREDWNYEVEGVTFDVSRYLEGEPEHWVRIEESEQDNPQKHVKIVYNVAASGGVNADMLNKRGSAVAALVECLEYSGRRVELWAGIGAAEHYRAKNDGFELHVKIKAYDQPLDMSRVAFALSHPAMLRRILFRFIEQDEMIVRVGSSYGYPAEVTTSEDDNLYIGEMMYGEGNWNDPAYVKHWLVENLRTQGVNVDIGEDTRDARKRA